MIPSTIPSKKSPAGPLLVPMELVARRIFIVRGRRVMLSPHLAELYQVETRALVQAVKRNLDRFPEDFMVQLTDEEYANLKSQIVTSSWGGARRANPYAFTEHGVAMLSSVLRSDRAVQMSIVIVRAFVKLREVLATNKALAQRIEQLTQTVKDHAALFDIVITDIKNVDRKFTKEMRRLKAPRRHKPRIGFHVPEDK
jgi:hypothetical protein